MSLYLFDNYQKLIKIIRNEDLIECTQEQEITPDKSELVRNNVSVVIPFSSEAEKASFMAVEEANNTFSLFKIKTSTDDDKKLFINGIDFAVDELEGYIVKEIRPRNESMRSVANRILLDTEFRLSHVDSDLPTVSGSFYYTSVKEALKTLQSYGCEIEFRCTLNAKGVERKWINIYKQMGKKSNERFTVGSNTLKVVKKVDRNNVYTSLIGRGKGEEVGETEKGDTTYGRRTEFADVVWSKRGGKPLNKPKGQIFLEDEELTKIYGIPLEDGSMRKREAVVIFEDLTDPEEILEKTYEQLVYMSRPLIEFSTETMSSGSLGDIATVHDYEKGYHYETRIFKTVTDRKTGKSISHLGDKLVFSSVEKAAKQINVAKELELSKTTLNDARAVSVYQTDIIRGAGEQGGSIFQMSPHDTGQGESRVPFQTVYMNGPSLNASDNFLVMNSQGLGFMSGDFWNAKYHNAWTIDGILNADFIRAGTLKGVQIISETEDFRIAMWNGVIRFIDKKSEKFLGSLNATLDSETKEVKGLAIRQIPGYVFSLNSSSETSSTSTPVFQIPKESHSGARLWNLYGTGKMQGDVDIRGKLMINGEQVYPGQGSGGGGGGWNGQYPPEVTSQADKFAWQLWMILLSKGYSKQAAAGILGNVQGEVGPSMNPDTDQVGGPAYGCVQWDGSAYPLVGPPTWNGREYVQRLMDAARINEDYRTMTAQGLLIEWCMYNGQWIGQVDPTSVTEFKKLTSPQRAAYAFEMNFERPRDAHPERQGYALEWYNKFKDLKQPTQGTYIRPMTNYVVTSEFGWRDSPMNPGTLEFHNAIDLANGGGSQIYASGAGIVVTAGPNYFDWYGNYVVIKHPDGLYTGYAHLSSVNVVVGQQVGQGHLVGLEGATGPVTGPHLHFQFMRTYQNGWPINGEADFINPRAFVNL